MKKQKTLVSILIINYNNGKLLARSINSCLEQKYKNIEILIFDDKSSDNSKKILNEYKKNKKVKIFFNKNKKKIYYQRASGLINSIMGKKSWYRPKVF